MTILNCKCLTCGKEFHIKQSRKNIGRGKYCSKECYVNKSPHLNKEWLKEKYCVENLSSSAIGEITNVCSATIRARIAKFGLKRKKTLTEEHKNKINPRGRILSDETKTKIRNAQLGELGHNWKGGATPLRFRSPWKQNKIKALKRDEFKCQVCGKTKQGNGERELDVHHKIPFRCFDNPIDAHNTENLITLCRSCHLQSDARKKIVDTVVGAGSVVWDYVNLYKAKIGKNVSVGAFCEIGKDVIIGDGSRIGAFSFIPELVSIGKNCFIGPRFCGINDKYPPSPKEEWLPTVIKNGASIGAACTVLCGVTIGERASIGAGSVVTKNVPAGETWCGTPARKIRR